MINGALFKQADTLQNPKLITTSTVTTTNKTVAEILARQNTMKLNNFVRDNSQGSHQSNGNSSANGATNGLGSFIY